MILEGVKSTSCDICFKLSGNAAVKVSALVICKTLFLILLKHLNSIYGGKKNTPDIGIRIIEELEHVMTVLQSGVYEVLDIFLLKSFTLFARDLQDYITICLGNAHPD